MPYLHWFSGPHRKLWLAALGAVVIGVVLQAVFGLLKEIPALGQIDATDATADFIQRSQADAAVLSPTFSPLTVIDFNNAAMAQAQWPAFTPREAIAHAIDAAVADGAALIVIDIDLGWRTTTTADDTLKKALQNAEAGRNPIGVILVREEFKSADGDRLSEIPVGPFDQLVAGSHDMVYASAAYPAEADGVVRRMAPAIAICTNGRAAMLPSAAIFAAAAFAFADAERGFRAVENAARTPPQGDCESHARRSEARPLTVILPSGGRLEQGAELGGPRIAYRLGYANRSGDPLFVTLKKQPVRVLERIPGASFLSASRVIPGQLRGRTVLIMSTAQTGRDVEKTPLGNLPGGIVLANAIAQLESGIVLSETSPALSLVLAALASLSTFLVWLGLRRALPRLSEEISSELIKLLTAAVWTGLAWAIFSRSAILTFAAPQYAVTLFLIFSERWTHDDHAIPHRSEDNVAAARGSDDIDVDRD